MVLNNTEADLEVPMLIDVWLKQTNGSLNDLASRDLAYIIEQSPDKSYWIIRFVKCRFPFADIIKWCNIQWGPECQSKWMAYNKEYNHHGLIIIVKDRSDLVLWNLTWNK